MGGGDTIRPALAAGLVDELTIIVAPPAGLRTPPSSGRGLACSAALVHRYDAARATVVRDQSEFGLRSGAFLTRS
jgi:hypothetical protein